MVTKYTAAEVNGLPSSSLYSLYHVYTLDSRLRLKKSHTQRARRQNPGLELDHARLEPESELCHEIVLTDLRHVHLLHDRSLARRRVCAHLENIQNIYCLIQFEFIV